MFSSRRSANQGMKKKEKEIAFGSRFGRNSISATWFPLKQGAVPKCLCVNALVGPRHFFDEREKRKKPVKRARGISLKKSCEKQRKWEVRKNLMTRSGTKRKNAKIL